MNLMDHLGYSCLSVFNELAVANSVPSIFLQAVFADATSNKSDACAIFIKFRANNLPRLLDVHVHEEFR